MNIRLAKYGTSGAVAMIEDKSSKILDVLHDENIDAGAACQIAARRLRTLARKFELLGMSADPFKEMTQAGINRRRIPGE